MSTVRARHDHVFRKPKGADEKCDAGLLLAAGDELAAVLVGLHVGVAGDGPPECSENCAVRTALRRWRKVTDG